MHHAYRKEFDKTKCMSFLIKDDELLEEYYEIVIQLNTLLKKKRCLNILQMT